MKLFPRLPLCLLAAALSLLCLQTTKALPHNVLVIIADDFGADSFPLTASGGSLPPMPNITALKNSGVLFSRAYAQPTCSPTRACILTGRHSFRTGIGAQLTGATSPQLASSEFTLPDAFAGNPGLGYALAMFGKWHLNAGGGTNDSPRTIGGWPSFAGSIIGALPDYSAWTKITDNGTAASTTYATTDTANDVISFITSRPAGIPWFAWTAFNAPHAPLHVPPAGLHTYGTPTTNRGMYEAMCQALDTEVGRVLANVNLATTNVIFIGDNGTPQNVIQTPYTAAHAKETIYEGGIRVPLIIAGPAVVSPNRTSTTRVSCVDLYATILELVGINIGATQPAANPLDSRSLLPLLQNQPAAARTVFSQDFSADLPTSVSGRALTDDAGFTLLTFDDGHEDLNEQNARFCVTPEFPAGTWAYFTTLNADGTPAFPYTTGRQYYGNPTGGAVTAITETVSTAFIGGPLKTESAGGISINRNNGNVTMTWSAVEGGTYQVQASSALASWTALTPSITAIGDDSFMAVDPGRASAEPLQFYRPLRTGLAAYDKTGFAGTYFTTVAPTGGGPNTVTPNTGTRGTAVSVVIQLDPALTPNLPPANAIVFSVTVSGTLVTSSALSRPSQTIVVATFTIDAAAATGARDVNVRFGSATGVQRNISGAFNVF